MDWQVRGEGKDQIAVTGVNADGATVAKFVLRAIDLDPEGGMTAQGIGVAALVPEQGYREITKTGEVVTDNLSPRTNALLVQLLDDLNAKQAQQPDGGGKGDLGACGISLVFLISAAVSGLLCPFAWFTCTIAVPTAAISAVSGLVCLIQLALN